MLQRQKRKLKFLVVEMVTDQDWENYQEIEKEEHRKKKKEKRYKIGRTKLRKSSVNLGDKK